MAKTKQEIVNDFLRDNNIKVFSAFAAISAYVGYPIDEDNIFAEEEE